MRERLAVLLRRERAVTAAPRNAWVEFRPERRDRQALPEERRRVLCQLPGNGRDVAPVVAVGYLRFGSGERDCPFFVVPGVGGVPTHWNDCLGDDFEPPLWRFY